MFAPALPNSVAPFFVQKCILFPVGIEYLELRTPERGYNLWKREPDRVTRSLSRKAKICSRELLSSINREGDIDAERCLRKCIWEIATVSPHVFYKGENGGKEELIFALGYDLSKHFITDNNEIAVVPGSNLALPRDENGTAFLPILKNRRSRVFHQLPSAPLRTLEPLPFQSYWKSGISKTADEALKTHVDFRIAAWCLERQPNGRRYIELVPAGEEQAERVWNEYLEMRIEFRLHAKNEFILKWGEAIPPDTIEEYLNRRRYLYNDKNEPILDDNDEPAYIFCMNIHHNHPVFWGGGNEVLTYIDRSFHNYIHQDFDQTLSYVKRCLGRHNQRAEKNIYEPDYLRKFLLRNPYVTDALEKIPHVRIDDGAIRIGILWPHERICIPSLLQFEYQYGGNHVPKNRGYDLVSGRAFAAKKRPRNGNFMSLIEKNAG